MAWLGLLAAGICEIAGVFIMKKYTDTRNRLYILLSVATFSVSFTFLSYAMKSIPMDTAYAIWTGIGTAGSALVGFVLFGERVGFLNILFIVMIAAGAVGLKLFA